MSIAFASQTLRTSDNTPTALFTYTPPDNKVFNLHLRMLIGRIASGADTNKGAYFFIISNNATIRRDGTALTSIATLAAGLSKGAGGDAAFTGTVAIDLTAGPLFQIVVTGIAGTDIDWAMYYWVDLIG